MIRSIQETLFEYRAVRLLVGAAILARGAARLILGSRYRAMDDICWVARVADVWPVRPLARGLVFRCVRQLKAEGNVLRQSYVASRAAADCAALYSLTGKGPHDLFRDVIVLKPASEAEKGVILLKYARTFDAVAAMFDVPRLMARYAIVLEPCWAGYCDPSLLMYVERGEPVFVQCFTKEDLQFVRDVGAPLVPLPLGPADWVNADVFRPQPADRKAYDLVMVANWAPHKRHGLLFRALRSVKRPVKVLLVGFPWAGRTLADIRREADQIGNPLVTVDLIERVPQDELAARVATCRAFVFLSRKEGDNKALVEAMFADVPAIVYERSIGGATSRINAATGVLTSDDDLARTIVETLDRIGEFTPRRWALENTGSAIATRVLDRAIAGVFRELGRPYSGGLVEKINAPNLAYKDGQVRASFDADYAFIMSCFRGEVGTWPGRSVTAPAQGS